jgi:PPOX class probable FMN-dependent enzyme
MRGGETSMSNDQAPDPAWLRSLKQALDAHGDDPSARFVQLATGGDVPANRTVAFRGFYPPHRDLLFATDCRSEKLRSLRRNPEAALCWYFPRTREQFRLTGTVTVVDRETRDTSLARTRVDVWGSLSKATRAQFFWPNPSEPRTGRFVIPSTTVKPSASFCLLILAPSRVDHLCIEKSPHHRFIHELQPDGTWSQREVNP